MSRTDKDAPYWVTAIWYEPWHHSHCVNAFWGGNRFGHLWPLNEPCTLPPTPVSRRPAWRVRGWRKNPTPCVWEAEFTYHSTNRRTTRAMQHYTYHRPQRQNSRLVLREAAKEFHGGGLSAVESEPHPTRPRCGWWE